MALEGLVPGPLEASSGAFSCVFGGRDSVETSAGQVFLVVFRLFMGDFLAVREVCWVLFGRGYALPSQGGVPL